jgi:hypothetical protein
MAIQKNDIKKLIYKSIDNHHSGSYTVSVSSAEKTEVNRIMGNFFSYVLDKHS